MKKDRVLKFEEFVNESIQRHNTPLELTTLKGMDKQEATELVRAAYPDNLTYKGIEFFDKIYMDTILEATSEKLGIGTYYDYEEEYEEDDGEWSTETTQAKIDGQDSYLGYIPETDTFINGWDMWDDIGENIVQIKLDDKGEVQNVEIVGYESMMYPRGYDTVHKKYPGIIDIRLD